ncbi:NADPH-dependent ferric siderophore reductase, contains FAD-binding and SIP domains [Thermostaphylospora chromogena]|uniref:NADPH-dependent ferric siderophore reductase, contains FAD-binding and SIP domains n=2 Tax=Thermostaphylospora chromogena TaxID=35622 RepID=A0A1H1BFI6_9ACTN|nr:NADPH-dependent ferric siderophore reductase, contains FAD-binding and SIP domains [Thermostaphylospora chromogena]
MFREIELNSGGVASRRSRSSIKPLERIFAKHMAEGTVADVGMVTPTMKRIRIFCETLDALPYTPGQHVRVEINNPLSLYGILRPGDTLRTYTIWEHSLEDREFELRAHLYNGDGIGRNWVCNAKVGDPVKFWGPMGDFATEPAPFHVFIGEETAAAAFGPMIRALGPDASVFGVLESETPEDEVPVPGRHQLIRVHRNGASAVASKTLLAGVSNLRLPGKDGMVYIAGEARTCQLIRNHLVHERGWSRKAIRVKPFWTPGKRGLHH